MTTHNETRTLPYSADVMYAIVADVEKYPQFLPWVTGLRVVRRISDTEFDAEMRVGFAGLSERYVSRVTLDPENHTIDVVKTQGGPFRRLENRWRFTPKSESASDVSFAIAFEFKNPILNAVAGRAFQTVMLQMASAFESRARMLASK
jgi:coenzyme Q-binding protein COQ10